MTEIEKRLERLLYERDLRHGWTELDASKAEYLDRTTNGMCVDIADDWNAAVNELRIIRYTARDDNDGECEMTVEITWAQLARIEVAIKAMGCALLRDEESFQSLLVEMDGTDV